MTIEKKIYINCKQCSTEFYVLYNILKELDPRFTDKGYSIAEMFLILKVELSKSDLHLMVELYDIHTFIQKTGIAWLSYLIQFSKETSLCEGGDISLVLTHRC